MAKRVEVKRIADGQYCTSAGLVLLLDVFIRLTTASRK